MDEEEGWLARRILLAFCAVVLLASLSVASLWRSGAFHPTPQDEVFPSAAALAGAVAGRTPEEVIAAVGRPDATSGDAWGGGRASWTYFGKVIDRATGRAGAARVTFRGGRADGARVPD